MMIENSVPEAAAEGPKERGKVLGGRGAALVTSTSARNFSTKWPHGCSSTARPIRPIASGISRPFSSYWRTSWPPNRNRPRTTEAARVSATTPSAKALR